jgi:uncharacterized protein (TIGR01244 family)
VGSQPSGKEIKRLNDKKFRSIINLRTYGEEEQPFEPDKERQLVTSLGMEYLSILMTTETIDENKVGKFRSQVSKMPQPIFVHCHTGKRSAAFAMMERAVEEDITGDKAVRKAEEMGFECDIPELEAFVKKYIDSHN